MRRGFAVGAAFFLVVVICGLAVDVQRQLGRLSSSPSDNFLWSIVQVELRVGDLERAAFFAASDDQRGLDEVFLRFDLLYSRIDTIKSGNVRSVLEQHPKIFDNLAEVEAFVDRWVVVIDGPEAALRASLSQLSQEAEAAKETARAASLGSLSLFAAQADERRSSLSETLTRIAVLGIALFALLALLLRTLARYASVARAAAQKNEATRQRIEIILNASLDAVVVSNSAGQIVEFNPAAERMFAATREAALGQFFPTWLFDDPEQSEMRQFIEDEAKGQTSNTLGETIVERQGRRRDGKVFPIDVSVAAVPSPDGQLFVVCIRDISERAMAQAALLDARDRALAGEKSKANVLAVMSHEIRTPLNGVLGTLDLFDESTLSERHRELIRLIRRSGEVLRSHVDDVLDITLLEAGGVAVKPQVFDLIEMLEELMQGQAAVADAQNTRLSLTPPDPIFRAVCTDPDRLRQIVLNLIGNALKFTKGGSVTIELDAHNVLRDVELRVVDTGAGIAEADLERVFEDFVTIDNSYARQQAGTGLGLGIARRMVGALGGSIGAESEFGEGSLFWIRLPMDLEPHPEDDDAAQGLPMILDRSLAILLVEDNDINRFVAKQLLALDSHQVTEAINGEEALVHADAQAFDVILMDISMPGLDGLEATKRIRSGPGPNRNAPILAVTAHALPQEIKAFDEAGFDGALTKPIDQARLRAALAHAVARVPLALPNGPAGPAGQAAPLVDMAHLRAMMDQLTQHDVMRAHKVFSREIANYLAADPDDAGQRAEAHRLAGSAGLFGAVQMTDLLRHLSETEDLSTKDIAQLKLKLASCWDATDRRLQEVLAPTAAFD